MPDPARYRRIADHHIERLIHKYNPVDQEIIQEYIDMVRAQQGTGAARVRSIVEILFTWRQVINKPFADWNLKGVFKGINTVRADRKPNTAFLYVLTLRSFLEWLITSGRSSLPLDEIKKINLPKTDKMTFGPGDILTEEEVRTVLSCCPTVRDRAFIAMLYDGGFRTKEMAMMSWKDLNFDVPDMVTAQTDQKTGIPRKVPLTACREYLTAWRNEYPGEPVGNNPVFVTAQGEPFNYDTAQNLIRRLRKKAKEKGIDPSRIKLHQFRRASITHDSNKGRPISHICMEKWGRSYSPMIERYAKPGEEDIANSKREASGVQPKRKYEKKATAMQPLQCPDCGTVNGPTLKFCGMCGRSLTGEGLTKMERMKRDVYENPDELIAFLQDLKKERESKRS